MQTEKEKSDALIAELYSRMYPTLLCYAKSNIRNFAVAEEMAQEAFTIACEHPDKILSSINPSGWLLVTLKNIICNYQRRKSLWAEIIKPCSYDEAANTLTFDNDNVKLLYRGIVSDEDFDLIISVEINGYTYKEAGSNLGISAEACRKRVKRAEKVFLEKSKNLCPVSGAETHSIKGGTNNVE